MEVLDPDIQNAIFAIQAEPEEARSNSFEMLMLYLEIQSLSKKYSKKDELSQEELMGFVTKMLQFRAQYSAMSMKLNVVIDLLDIELVKRGISFPK